MVETTDNRTAPLLSVSEDDMRNLSEIAAVSVNDLAAQNPGLLVFPRSLAGYGGDFGAKSVFSLSGNDLITHNTMGFIGINGPRKNTMLRIASRFQTGRGDYFLHYMLQKVFSVNVVDMKFGSDDEGIWDFLLYVYLFPALLNSAIRQGLYREYVRREYNDANVRGAIDVSRHLRLNVPFRGRIAYAARERSLDNPVTQLIRHTVEHIKSDHRCGGILSSDSETAESVRAIVENTPGYDRNGRAEIISKNSGKPVNHPYFTSYAPLQKICLRILRDEKVTTGEDDDRIYGLLFDGSWLWEEYLDKVFKENNLGWSHPDNRTGAGVDCLFEDGQRIFPDFIKRNVDGETAVRVGDAKYKFIDKRGDEAGREDYYQLITYMYRYRCDTGFLLFPHSGDSLYERTHRIKGHDGKSRCIEVGLKIEQRARSFEAFAKSMEENEGEFIGAIKVK
jgi:5-methylcytosine-specific restriction endonuclease McrBC regulatory subunit McrC